MTHPKPHYDKYPFKDYTINMILIMCKSLILLMYVDISMKNKFIHCRNKGSMTGVS